MATAEALEKLTLAAHGALFGGVAALAARRLGFFQLPPCETSPPPPPRYSSYLLFTALLAFGAFLSATLFFAPFLSWLIFCNEGSCRLSAQERGWMTVATMALGLFSVLPFALTRAYGLRRALFGSFSWRSCGRGALAWFLGYPAMVAIGQSVAAAVAYFIAAPSIEQVAVQELKKTASDPLLFAATIAGVTTLVPLLEEILFRGLLLSTLYRFFSPAAAIAFSALIFALFHYAPEQGWSNAELLASLFTFSCLLGFLYLRERNLWASVALHATFNALSVAFIFI